MTTTIIVAALLLLFLLSLSLRSSLLGDIRRDQHRGEIPPANTWFCGGCLRRVPPPRDARQDYCDECERMAP